MKCKCEISYGWSDYLCQHCGKDVRGVWSLTHILEEKQREQIKSKRRNIRIARP